MEVLETARIDAFCCNDIVVPASRRKNVLVVIWEGNCVERESTGRGKPKRGLRMGRSHVESTLQLSHGTHDDLSSEEVKRGKLGSIWYAGDWTGPRALQPEKKLSGDSSTSETHDIVAMSAEGVKVITVDFTNLQYILKNGSPLYRKYLSNISQENCTAILSGEHVKTNPIFEKAVKNLNTLELLNSNTLFRKLTAVQKRHLECLVEGPVVYDSGQRLWRMGSIVEKAFIVVAGTVSFVPKRRNAVSGGNVKVNKKKARTKDAQEKIPAAELEKNGESFTENILGDSMRIDAIKVVRELHAQNSGLKDDDENSISVLDESDYSNSKLVTRSEESNSLTQTEDFVRLSRGLQKWAEQQDVSIPVKQRRGSSSTDVSPEVSLHDFCGSTTVQDESVGVGRIMDAERKKDVSKMNLKSNNNTHDPLQLGLKRPTKDRFANKVLGRLYNRRAVASGLVFSRGHFLGDIEKMVEGLLSSTEDGANKHVFGDSEDDALSLDTMTIHEYEGAQHVVHSSTLAAGKDGCIVLVLPKAELIPFLDEHPGLLLSLLGTQVVV